MVQMTTGIVPSADMLADTLAYVSFQELATQVAHRNTGQALDKTLRGKKIMSQIAGDEGLHHAFYRDLATAAIERDPSLMVVAIARRLRELPHARPGHPRLRRARARDRRARASSTRTSTSTRSCSRRSLRGGSTSSRAWTPRASGHGPGSHGRLAALESGSCADDRRP